MICISCIFGTKFKYVHPSPNTSSYFFTNNKQLKHEILSKKWKYIYVNMKLLKI